MDNNEYISKQKVEKWTTKEKFNALGDLRDIEPGTEYNLTGAIEEGELDSALQTKINGKLTAPATPTAESAVTMLADGTVGTKLLSEFGGGGKLYLHKIYFYKTGEGTVYFYITSYKSDSYTLDEFKTLYYMFPARYEGRSGFGFIALTDVTETSITLDGVINSHGQTYIFNSYHFEYDASGFHDTVTEL